VDKQINLSDGIGGLDSKSRRTRLVLLTCALGVALGGMIWYSSAANSYRKEQEALQGLKSRLPDGSVRILDAEAERDAQGNVDHVAVEIRLHWAHADWLRTPIEAVGEPVLQLVEFVTIYDSDINDAIIETLTNFSAMKKLTIAGDTSISRDGIRQLKKALPNIAIWIEHDEKAFQSRDEDIDEDDDGNVSELYESEQVSKVPVAVLPSPATEEWTDEWWMTRHEEKLNEPSDRGAINLVMIGDSNTHDWEEEGKKVWQEFYAERNVLNLGFSGDCTKHVLWRLQHGEIDGIVPKLVVLMIGTNNSERDAPKDTAAGI